MMQQRAPLVVKAAQHGQRIALWHLEGSLERTLPELFSADYDELLAEAMQDLESRF